MTALMAWLAPLLLGGGVCVLARGRPRNHADWCTLLGVGWLVGLLLLGWIVALFSGLVSPRASVPALGPWLLLLGAALIGIGWFRGRTSRPATPSVHHSLVVRLLVAALLLLLAWHGWLALREAWLRPLFPWDAWAAWAIKPKTWFGLDQWVPFTDYAHWLGSASPALHTGIATAYPEMLGRLEVWFASGAGCWCDPAYTVLWPALWLAMLLAGYGLLRSLGCGLLPAVVAMYALGSLPMVDIHAALPGYADLWLAALFGLALLLWLHWHRERHRGSLVLALVMALSLPAIKVEGSIWMLLWLATLGLGVIPRRWRWKVVLGCAAVLVLLTLAVIVGGLDIPVPGMGWLQVADDRLQIARLSDLPLGWQPVAGAVLASLLVLANWHLLFWLTIPLLAWRWHRLRAVAGLRPMGLCLLGGAAFLFVLFFLTGAGAWAADQTSFNRLVLQWVPALVFFLALLFSEPPPRPQARGTAPATG